MSKKLYENLILNLPKNNKNSIDRHRLLCYNCITAAGTLVTLKKGYTVMIYIDNKSSKPIYEQIIEQMKYHIAKGNLKEGDPIPSVRKLALDMSITPGTVAKAYQELERDHIIETIRGKGTFIASEISFKRDDAKLGEVKKSLRSGILEMKMMGLSEKEVQKIVAEIYNDLSV